MTLLALRVVNVKEKAQVLPGKPKDHRCASDFARLTVDGCWLFVRLGWLRLLVQP